MTQLLQPWAGRWEVVSNLLSLEGVFSVRLARSVWALYSLCRSQTSSLQISPYSAIFSRRWRCLISFFLNRINTRRPKCGRVTSFSKMRLVDEKATTPFDWPRRDTPPEGVVFSWYYIVISRILPPGVPYNPTENIWYMCFQQCDKTRARIRVLR